jgi:hypothetical protein
MTTRKNLLDRVEIASPCTANWDAMTGTDQIRFCSECRKYVYNLSEMTRREAEALLASRGNQMCARLIRDLNGATLSVDSLPPVRLLGWKPGPVASAVVSAIISITPGAGVLANGQSPSHSSQSVDASGHRTHRPAPGTMTSTITGIVSDENTAPMSGAIVTLTSESTGEALSQLTSEEGEFRFEGLPARTYIVEVRFKGYRVAAHHDVNLQQGEARRFDVAMEKLIAMTGVSFIPPQPLRTLYLNSDRVVVAQVGKSTADATEGSARSVKTSLTVSWTIKGDGHKPAIDVDDWVYGQEQRFTEGETVLAFLQRGEDAKDQHARDSYKLVSGSESARRLSPSDLEAYVQHLEELKAAISKAESEPADLVEWLVRCAEDPITRHEGAYELNASAWREQWQKEYGARSATAGGPLGTPHKSTRDNEPLFAALLTRDQKQRLMNALLKSGELGDGDFELIELAKRWNDPRVLPFLISYLRHFRETAPQSAQRVMQSVADLLDDDKLGELLRDYTKNASYEDIEAAKDTEAEDADEDDADGAAGRAETTDANDEVDTAPKLTPEAAKQARVEMLKKFLEAVEARMKVAPAK